MKNIVSCSDDVFLWHVSVSFKHRLKHDQCWELASLYTGLGFIYGKSWMYTFGTNQVATKTVVFNCSQRSASVSPSHYNHLLNLGYKSKCSNCWHQASITVTTRGGWWGLYVCVRARVCVWQRELWLKSQPIFSHVLKAPTFDRQEENWWLTAAKNSDYSLPFLWLMLCESKLGALFH